MYNLSIYNFLIAFKYPETHMEMGSMDEGILVYFDCGKIDYIRTYCDKIFLNESDLYEYLSQETINQFITDPDNSYIRDNNLKDKFMVLPHRTNISYWFGLTLDNLKEFILIEPGTKDSLDNYVYYNVSINHMSFIDKSALYSYLWNNCIHRVIDKLHNYSSYVFYISENVKLKMKEIFIKDDIWKFSNINDLHSYLDNYSLFNLDDGSVLSPIIFDSEKIDSIIDDIPMILNHNFIFTDFQLPYPGTLPDNYKFPRTRYTIRFKTDIDENHCFKLIPFTSDLQFLINDQLNKSEPVAYRNGMDVDFLVVDAYFAKLFIKAKEMKFDFLKYGIIDNLYFNDSAHTLLNSLNKKYKAPYESMIADEYYNYNQTDGHITNNYFVVKFKH